MLTFAWQNLITRFVRTLLAIVGLTIPSVAILGLFSLTNGIRSLMSNTLARMKGLMVMRADAPAPVFSEIPAGLAGKIRAVPGVRIVAPEVWRIAPPLEGRNVVARAAAAALTHPGKQGLSQFAETIMIDGEQLPANSFCAAAPSNTASSPQSAAAAGTSTNPTWASPTPSSVPRSRATIPTPTVHPRKWEIPCASATAPSR
jgi:hypothetical protein